MPCLLGLPTILTAHVKVGFFLSNRTSLTCRGQRERDITQSHYILLSLICGINSNVKFRRFGFFNLSTLLHIFLCLIPMVIGLYIVAYDTSWFSFSYALLDCRLKIINYLIHIWPWIQIFLSYLVLIRCILGLSLKMLAVVLLMKPPLNRGQVIARTGQWIRNSLFTSLRSTDCRSNSPNSHLSQT